MKFTLRYFDNSLRYEAEATSHPTIAMSSDVQFLATPTSGETRRAHTEWQLQRENVKSVVTKNI
jgi:hypothetical protein